MCRCANIYIYVFYLCVASERILQLLSRFELYVREALGPLFLAVHHHVHVGDAVLRYELLTETETETETDRNTHTADKRRDQMRINMEAGVGKGMEINK